jgi:hypothetical protein
LKKIKWPKTWKPITGGVCAICVQRRVRVVPYNSLLEIPFWAVFGLFLYITMEVYIERACHKNVQLFHFKNVDLVADQSSGLGEKI